MSNCLKPDIQAKIRATHVFSKLVRHFPFLQLQGYISLLEASNLSPYFLWLAPADIPHWVAYLAIARFLSISKDFAK